MKALAYLCDAVLGVSIGLLLFILLFGTTGCAVFDGLHQFRSGQVSPPAYPASIADEPIIWHEGGEIDLIDNTGVHKIGTYDCYPTDR
jgi:hypothetical protein